MELLKKFVRLSFRTAGTIFGSGSEKFSVLDQLRDSGKPVTVKLDGDPRPYTGVITAVDEKQLIFVLDNLYPLPHAGRLSKGCMVAILAIDSQKTVSFTCRCLGPLVPEQDMGYMMKLGISFEVNEFENRFDFGIRKAARASERMPERKAA